MQENLVLQIRVNKTMWIDVAYDEKEKLEKFASSFMDVVWRIVKEVVVLN